MSIKASGANHAPADTVSMSIRCAIVMYLQTHGPTTAVDLDQVLARTAACDGQQGLTWLHGCLTNLSSAGHIHAIEDNGRRLWAHGPEPVACGAPTPRQVVLLDGSVYQPALGPVLRAGAMDFARLPSVFFGKRRVFGEVSR